MCIRDSATGCDNDDDDVFHISHVDMNTATNLSYTLTGMRYAWKRLSGQCTPTGDDSGVRQIKWKWVRERRRKNVIYLCYEDTDKTRSAEGRSRTGTKAGRQNSLRITEMPVSYTHLDVYKRQSLDYPYSSYYLSREQVICRTSCFPSSASIRHIYPLHRSTFLCLKPCASATIRHVLPEDIL